LGHATVLGDRPADALFACPAAVLVRGVDEREGSLEDAADRGDGGVLVDLIAVLGGEAPEGARADTDIGDGQTGTAELTDGHGLFLLSGSYTARVRRTYLEKKAEMRWTPPALERNTATMMTPPLITSCGSEEIPARFMMLMIVVRMKTPTTALSGSPFPPM